MRSRPTADGSSSLRMVSESCHHSPSTGPRRPSLSIALRSFWLIVRTSVGPVEGGPPGVERRRPRLDVGDVLETARDRLDQLRLLARRPEEDARLVHERSRTKIAQTTRRGGTMAKTVRDTMTENPRSIGA